MSISFLKLAQSGIGIILSSLFGVALIKMISIKGGADDLGYFGVFRQFIQLLTVIFTLGNGFSIIEGMAQSNSGSFLKKASGYVFWVALALSTIVLIFNPFINIGIFGDSSHSSLIFLLPVMIFCMAYTLLIKAAYAGTERIVISGIVGSFSYFFMFVISIFSTKLLDLFLYSSLLSFVSAFVIFSDRKMLWPTFKFERLVTFEKTSVSTAITGVTGFFSFLFVRSFCIRTLGPTNGGFLESSWSLATYTTLVFLTSLSVYYLPQITKKPNDVEFRKKFFLIIHGLALLSLLFLCLVKDFIIPILFSKEFLPSSDLLVLMSIGEYLKAMNWFFIFSLIGMTRKRQYLVLDTAANILFIMLPLMFVNLELKSFGYFYIAYQGFYLLGALILNFKYKIIPTRIALLSLAAGTIVWIGYLVSNGV